MKVNSQLNIKLLSAARDLYSGQFQIGPFPKGVALTVGNALRRSLYNLVPGVAVIGYQVDRYNHEYTTIPGVSESLLHIGLNLKKLLIKFVPGTFDPEQVVTLKLTKKYQNSNDTVTGADIVCPAGVTVVNPELVICNLTTGGKITMEIFCSEKTGYFLEKVNKKQYAKLGVINLDSNHAPIKRATFRVLPIASEESYNLESLELSVVTNKTVSATQLVDVAATQLGAYLKQLTTLSDSLISSADHDEGTSAGEQHVSDPAQLAIVDLGLPLRCRDSLLVAGIKTVAQLLTYSKAEVCKIKGLGKKSLLALQEKLLEFNLQLSAPKKK